VSRSRHDSKREVDEDRRRFARSGACDDGRRSGSPSRGRDRRSTSRHQYRGEERHRFSRADSRHERHGVWVCSPGLRARQAATAAAKLLSPKAALSKVPSVSCERLRLPEPSSCFVVHTF